MSRARLERRVGPVMDLGCAVLPGHRHRFNKLGEDGTGKGNVEPAAGESVYGVLYVLNEVQLEVLAEFEGGYVRVEREVKLPHGEVRRAATFVGVSPGRDLQPSAEYLAHYRRGLREHAIPAWYVVAVLG